MNFYITFFYTMVFLIIGTFLGFYISTAKGEELPITARLVTQDESCKEFGTNCPGEEPIQGEITAEVIKSLAEIEPAADAEWTPEMEHYE